MIDKPGVYTISAQEYHADPCPDPSLSSGVAEMLLDRSPAHARAQHPRLNPGYVAKESEAFDLGTAAHQFILEGATNFAIIPASDWRTKASKERRDDARADGKVPLLEHQWRNLERMVEALLPQFSCFDPPPFTGGKAEQTIIWQEQGIWLRIRVDYLYPWGADDLKSTQGSAHPAVWSRRLFDAGYDVQDGLYRRGMKAVLGIEPEFRFIVCEAEPPYGCAPVALDPEGLAFANQKVERAIELWAECLRTNHWPAYSPRTAYAEVPGYLVAQWQERQYYAEEVSR